MCRLWSCLILECVNRKEPLKIACNWHFQFHRRILWNSYEILWNPVCIGKGREVRWQRDQESIIVGQMWCGKYRSRKNEIKLQSTVGLSLIWLVLIKYSPGVSSVKYYLITFQFMDFPGVSVVKNPPAVQELQGTRVWSLDQEDPLEEVMATHSSILLRKIPWTEESGGLQFIGLQKRTRLKNLTQSLYFEELWFLHFCAWYYIQIHFVY